MVFFHFFIFVLCVFPIIGQESSFGKLEVVSDMLPEDCFNQGLDYLQVSTNNLPTCISKFNTKNKCSKFFSKSYSTMVYKPTNCAKDGSFEPVQCKGERTTGRCFCYDAVGIRIFGQQWWSQATNMTCACSRRKSDMTDSVYFNSLHCKTNGNYEELQCDVISEQCWCADEQTGSLTSPVVPSVAMSQLPCYDSVNIGSRYLRQCENQKYARKAIEYQLSLRGTKTTYSTFLCDDDGSYGAYAISDGIAYCTWRDNSKVGSWQTGDNIDEVDCNCARDTKLFSQIGKSQSLKCTSNGNYKNFQDGSSTNVCVDSDGYRKSPSNKAPKTEDECDYYKSFSEYNQ